MSTVSLFLAGLASVSGAPVEDPSGTGPTPMAAAHGSPDAVPAGPDPVYPAEFYAAFQPQTALDMLNRTPGFLLSEGSSVRGFGGAAGNVLIDGQRPTVKGGGVAEVLRRISASQVERVVLLRGTDAAEAQGQTLVANVILRVDGGGSGNASLTLSRTADGNVLPSARISHARRIAGWQTNIELSGESVRYPSNSTFLNTDAGGALTRTRLEESLGKAPEFGAALSTSGDVAGGTLTANLRLNRDTFESASRIAIFEGPAQDTPDAIRTIAYKESGWSGELGTDWTGRVGKSWTAKLVGLGRVERGDVDEDYAEPGYRGLSQLERRPLELVGRATLAREGDFAFRPEVGMEIAYNRLTSQLDYAEDLGGGLTPVVLGNAQTRVAELRGEAFVNTTVRLDRKLNLEAGAAIELSRIRVTGGAASEQSLSYLKPSAALVWSPTGKTQLRLGARRTVDQLDFSDFAASVNQADGRPLGGNSGLRPARVTRALARVDHRWGQGGAIAVEAYHQWHTGLLGYLVLDNGDEALGIIGNGRQWGVTAQGSLVLDAVLRGARLTLDGALRGSRLRDRITGRNRHMDDISPRSLTAEFRHDVTALKSSWGVEYTAAKQGDVVYTGEVLTWRVRSRWAAYVETTAFAGFKTTLKASGITGQDEHRLRRFYAPSRAGSYAGAEDRDLQQGMIVSLTAARSF